MSTLSFVRFLQHIQGPVSDSGKKVLQAISPYCVHGRSSKRGHRVAQFWWQGIHTGLGFTYGDNALWCPWHDTGATSALHGECDSLTSSDLSSCRAFT